MNPLPANATSRPQWVEDFPLPWLRSSSLMRKSAEISEVIGSLKIFVKRLSGFGENRHL
jgi:hypothetical protein